MASVLDARAPLGVEPVEPVTLAGPSAALRRQ